MAEPKDKKTSIGSGKGRSRKRNEDLSNFVFGKVQPQAVPLEEAVLGALMLDKEALAVVLDILRADSFYLEAHQMIYKAMLRLFERSQPIDLLTVAEELRKTGELEATGGPAYISELTMKVASAANIEYHARIISQKYIQRELITVSTKIIRDAFEDTTDVFQLLDDAEQGLFDIAQQNMSRGFDSMGALASKALKQMEELRTREDGLTGVPSGFTEVDRLTSGWQPSDLVILAARPGMGKCLGKGTKVVMYDGSLKKVEDIQVGEQLMGDDSTPRTVLSLARGRERMYWIRQKHGIDYRVNESHILSLKDAGGQVRDIAVTDYLRQSIAAQQQQKGYKVAVSFPEQPLAQSPYEVGLQVSAGVHAPVAVGAAFAEKQSLTIPSEYLVNTRANRLAVLAGLLDGSDTALLEETVLAVTVERVALLEPLKWLADSLGFRTEPGESLTLFITGNLGAIPFRQLSDVIATARRAISWQTTPIRLEYDRVDDYFGFEIDGNRRFLLEDMTVTHNTSFVLSMAKNAALDFQKPVAVFSLEMSSLQLAQRIISIEAEIEGSKMRNGQLEEYEWQQLHSAIERISEIPIFIDDTPGINVFELRAKCRRLKMQHDIQMVIIDYLQLMTGGGENAKGNREQEISAISRALKGLAKELQVPVIALSQLSRAVEMRGGSKRPQLSDLRECLTGDSLIYRPDTSTFERLENLVGQSGFQVLAMDKNLKLRPSNCLDVWETGEKEVYEVTTQSGFKIKASLNHPFYTDEGWKQLVDIKEGDLVASAPAYCPSPKDEIIHSLNPKKAKSTTGKVAVMNPPVIVTSSDIQWEKITSIVHIGREKTYDIHVEEHHNFVANGLIVHNSGAIEQDADIVSFIYRPEYYQILEDEEGQSLKGVAELIVAKNRHGAQKTIKLRFTDRFARFSDLDDPNFDDLPEDTIEGPFQNIITRPSKMNSDEDIPF
jgi:replicative DNA helicase